ncbi:unnamed protein product [Diatraea saccharalis]|uniref:FHA domain-containing protein n=1 Tax=Diatraea saccharalis TaxID=40085 RepID=A0A9N9RF27_9NEOP|nr:unnamed protein product [Diatraea saccharalis]
MSGGRLVVLDRLGREVKRFPLTSGLATLGSHPRCDIRVMLPSVSPHHATVVVHANQYYITLKSHSRAFAARLAREWCVAPLRHCHRGRTFCGL